ncbi:MAG TPA: ABC-type transport auxiliary lipoprotein family protein [Rhizomicrobium sp.]|jgi:cholesterol transport system auxiliary component|nr:ABC-type transport auxiliary lipoprotein family protein [Rhizomicrobium sp.]
MNQNYLMPSRRGLLVGTGALLLSGCSDLIGPSSTPQQLYVLRPTGGVSTNGPKVSWSLAISASAISDHLDSSRIALTQPDNSVDYYAGSAWTDHLPRLVRDALVEAFENSGRIAAVSSDSEGFHADYILQAQIRDFEARYTVLDGIPTVWVRVESKMAPSKGREIIASLNSIHQVQATANSVPAAVRAFNDAMGAVVSDVVNWALSQPAPPE